MDKIRKLNSNQEYFKESTHTQLSYWFCVIAVGIELTLGLRYMNEYFGQMCLLEAFFGICGLLFLDPIHGRGFKIYPKPFKKLHKNTFFRFGTTFAVIVVIQFIFQIVPLVSSTEMALGIVFCAVVEEYFFRGVLLEPFFRFGARSKSKIIIWKYKDKPAKEISYIEIGGIVLGGAIFSAFHINYYSQPNLLWMVFVGGILLGASYFLHKDLTPLILSHFLLNIVFVYQFYQVGGLG